MPADVPEEAAAARGTLVTHIQRRRRVQHCAEHLARDGGREGWRLRLRCGLRRGCCGGPLLAVAVRSTLLEDTERARCIQIAVGPRSQ
jgi:hypothetical protein